MIDELVFRIIFTALWIVFVSILTWVRYLARQPKSEQPPSKEVKKEHLWYMVALALFAIVWFSGIILYIFIPNLITPLSIPLPDLLRIAMAVITVISIPFVAWSYLTIGKNWVHALEPSKFKQKEDDKLIKTGPYKYVRNPIYFWCFTFIVTLALESSNLLILIPVLMLIALLYAQIGNEEKMLLDRFGDEYRKYMKQTPRLIPKIKS